MNRFKIVFVFMVAGLLLPVDLKAQEALTLLDSFGKMPIEIWLLVTGVAIILLMATIVLFYAVENMKVALLGPPIAEETPQVNEENVKGKRTVWQKLLGLQPLDAEKDLILDHDYDGIFELDNPTPVWFKVLFYSTIVIGAAYFTYFHILDLGKLQEEEYRDQLVLAEIQKQKFREEQAAFFDEENPVLPTDENTVTKGSILFMKNCTACHGNSAEGNIGPNLTDEFWIHGGQISDIFKTIKNGVPQKMMPWGNKLSSPEIMEVVSYLVSLKGSNPPNAKEPQGVKVD